MTVKFQRSTSKHLCRRLRHSSYLFIFFVGATTFLWACGSDEPGEVSGSLVETSVSPEAGYPDVELTVSLEIDPQGAPEDEISWTVDFGDGNRRSGDSLEATATHAYSDVGEYRIVVEALHNGETADTDEIFFTVYDPVDVSVGSVSAQPVNILVGEDATVSFTVENLTASPVFTPVTLRAYLSPTTDVTREQFDAGELDDLVPLGEQVLQLDENDVSLNPGASRNVSINAPIPEVPTGDYHTVVVLDPDHELQTQTPEATLASSIGILRIENLDANLPNISVDSLETLPDRAFPELSRFTRAFELSNLGGVDVFNVVHKTYLQPGSSTLDDDAILVHTSDPINLSVHQSEAIGPDEFILSEPITAPDDEELELFVIVEAFSEDGDIEEATTDNNIISSDDPIIVSNDPVEGPDIVVEDFSVSPDSTFLDGTLDLETTIANRGTSDVPSFFCGIYMSPQPVINFGGDPQIQNINLTGLSAGDETHIEDELYIPALHDPGVYYFYIVCDPHGAIDQQYRGNSQAIHLEPITVTDEADIDLYVDSISLPEFADDGDNIIVEATVCVAGSNASGTTLGELHVSSGTDVDFDGEPYKTFEVPSVSPGECVELELEAQARCQDFVDEWSVGVYVDADESLPEDNRDNNKLTSSTPLLLQGPYCECIEDDFGPNQTAQSAHPVDVAPGTPAHKEASLCVPGGCDYYMVELLQGETLLVDIYHDSERGPLKSRMLNPAGSTTLDFDDSDDYQQIRRFLASSDDDPGIGHLFRVCAQDGNGRNYYEMDIDIYPQAATVDVLPHNIEIPPQESFSVGATFDVDLRIYNLGEQPTGPFDAQLVLTKERDALTLGEGDDIVLATHPIDSLSPASHRDVSLEVTLSSFVDDGDYFIGVNLDPYEVLNDENPENQIGFTDQFSIETDCYDAFTPNDSFDEAAAIEAGVTYVNLVACTSSNNYYQICAPSGHSMEATIDGFDPADGDIDLRLFDHTLGSPIDTSGTMGADSETVSVDYIDGDQCYYLQTSLVTVDAVAENSYNLRVELDELPADMQCNDTFEPNDDFQTASSLWEALDYGGELDRCPSYDIDVYSVQLSPESTVDISASLDPPNQSGTLFLQLHGPNFVPLAFAETGPGNPTASIEGFTPSTTGPHYVRIDIGGDEHRVTYSLDAQGLPGIDLAAKDLRIGSGTYVEGDQIRYDFLLTNFGGDHVDSVTYHVYLGSSATPGSSDSLLGAFEVTDIAPDETIELEGQTNVPSSTEPGEYYVHVVVDPDEELDDVNLSNNVTSVPIIIVESEGDDDNGEDS